MVLVAQSCLALCDPTDCSPPGSSIHAILQARILEWVALHFSRGSSQPRDWTQVSCTVGRFFTISATRELPEIQSCSPKKPKERPRQFPWKLPTIGRTLATNGVKSKFLFSHFGGAFNLTVKLPEDTKACMPQSGKKSNSQDTDQEAKWEATAVPGE